MKKVTVELNERETTVLKSVLNENNELDFFASLEKMSSLEDARVRLNAPEKVGGKIKSVKHFIGKVIYCIGLLFIITIGLVIPILGLMLIVEYIPIVYTLFWL